MSCSAAALLLRRCFEACRLCSCLPAAAVACRCELMGHAFFLLTYIDQTSRSPLTGRGCCTAPAPTWRVCGRSWRRLARCVHAGNSSQQQRLSGSSSPLRRRRRPRRSRKAGWLPLLAAWRQTGSSSSLSRSAARRAAWQAARAAREVSGGPLGSLCRAGGRPPPPR